MKPIFIFQSYASYKPNVLLRLFENNRNDILCDLEDAIQDVDFPHRNRILKTKARSDLKLILANTKTKISVRVNAVNSPFFTEDIELIKEYKNKVSSVFLPKVSSEICIEYFFQLYGSSCKINPIIETKKGFDNIDNILSSKYKNEFQFVFFGNYDFHLDEKIFPINEQYSKSYWDIVYPLIEKIEKKGLKYGNSAYVNVSDEKTNQFIVRKLNNKCENGFALISLHNIQTEIFNRELKHAHTDDLGYSSFDELSFQPKISDYKQSKQKGRSFAFNNNSIITPQEYILLKKYEES